MLEEISVCSSRRPQWRSAVLTCVACIVIVCLKFSWINPLDEAQAGAGTLATTEFLLHGQQARANAKQQTLALQHIGALARRKNAVESSALHQINAGSSRTELKVAAAPGGQALEEVAANGTGPGIGQPAAQGESARGNFVSHADSGTGWDKRAWSAGDWASWLITGPGISIAFSFFMFYTYGTLAGVLTLVVCACIDLATFYYNW